MQLRPADRVDNADLDILARDHKIDEEFGKAPGKKTGGFRVVPVATTTAEGIGTDGGVHYGIITQEETSAGVYAEKRPVWGQDMHGVMTFNE